MLLLQLILFQLMLIFGFHWNSASKPTIQTGTLLTIDMKITQQNFDSFQSMYVIHWYNARNFDINVFTTEMY